MTTNFVLAETHALVLHRLGRAAALSADETRAQAIIARYTDKRFSYTDATSFAVMERLGVTQVFTFDRDFAQYGFTQLVPNQQ